MNEWQEQGPWIPRNICLTCARSSLWQLWGYTNKCWNEAWLIDHRGWYRMFTDCNEAPDNKWLCVSMEGQINGKSCDSKPWLATLWVHRPELTRQSNIWIDRYKVLFKCHLKMWCSQERDTTRRIMETGSRCEWRQIGWYLLTDILCCESYLSTIRQSCVMMNAWVSANLTVFAADNELSWICISYSGQYLEACAPWAPPSISFPVLASDSECTMLML